MFDSLKCAKMLMDHGLDRRQAEGVTNALKVQMNTHLVTKEHFEKEFAILRSEIKLMFEMQNQKIDSKFESFEKSIAIRFGSMLAGAVVLLSALQSALFIMLK